MAAPDQPVTYEGIDLDWFAVDDDGRIGHFSTAGSRVVAPSAVASRERLDRLYRYFEGLPMNSLASPAPKQQPGDLEIWRDMARKGLYSYEFVSEDTWVWERGSYELVFSPSPSLLAADLPADIRDLLNVTRLKGVKFARDLAISKELILKA